MCIRRTLACSTRCAHFARVPLSSPLTRSIECRRLSILTLWLSNRAQTNIASNNNKFYLVQVLESDRAPHTYWAWFRWGRVGRYPGQFQLHACGSNVEQALHLFNEKCSFVKYIKLWIWGFYVHMLLWFLFHLLELLLWRFSAKTKNKWSERHNFKKVQGKYDLIQLDYSSKEVQALLSDVLSLKIYYPYFIISYFS